MKERSGVTEVISEVKDIWAEDINKYLLPAVEVFLLSIMLSMVIAPFSILLQFVFLIPLFLVIEYGMMWLIPFLILIGLGIYLIVTTFSIIVNSVIMGGTSKVSRRLLNEEEYGFFDILKAGWRNKGIHIRIFISTVLIQMGIMISIILLAILATVASALFVLVSPFLIIIPILVGLSGLVVYLLAGIFFMIYQYMSFTYHNLYGTGGFASAKGALRFMWSHKGSTMAFGGIIYLVTLVASLIPVLGILIGAALPIFLHQCAIIFMKERGPVRKRSSKRGRPFR